MCRSYKKSLKGNKTKFCANCMQSVLKKIFNDHTRVCSENTPLRIAMPSPETKLKFCNWQKTQRCTFTVYADLEALLVAEQKSIGRSTIAIENEFPASYGAVLVDSRSNSVVKESFYRGEYSINKLVDCLRRWLKFCDGEKQKYRDLKKVSGTKEREQLLRSNAKNVVYAKAKLKVMRSSIIIMQQARCMDSLTWNVN